MKVIGGFSDRGNLGKPLHTRFRFGKNLDLDVSWRYVDRNTGSALLTPYALLDAKLNYAFPWMSLFFRANNLLNRTWYDFGDIPQPGLWLMAGVSCRVKAGR